MKRKSKIIIATVSSVSVATIVVSSIIGGIFAKTNNNSSDSSLNLSTKNLHLSSLNDDSSTTTNNSQTLYAGLDDIPSDLVANYSGKVPNNYHLQYQWYSTSSASNKKDISMIYGATSNTLSASEMGIKVSNNTNQTPYYYLVKISLVSNVTNKVISTITSDVYTINISNQLNSLQIKSSTGSTTLNTVASSNTTSVLLTNNNQNQKSLSATPSITIPSGLKTSWQWYYSGDNKEYNSQNLPTNGQEISVNSSNTKVTSNSTANDSLFILNNNELSKIGTYYYYVVLTITAANGAKKTVTSSYYTVDVQKNTVITSVSAQASSSNVVVNQKNFTNYQISLNPNISYTSKNSNTNFTYQWYRSPDKLNTSNVEAFINDNQKYLITANDNSTASQQIYYLNDWDSSVSPNSTYYYYLLITGTTYGIGIKPILTTTPVTVSFDSTPTITTTGNNSIIQVLDTASSYTLQPNVEIGSSTIPASSTPVYQWYYTIDQQISDSDWQKSSISLNNDEIQVNNLSALNEISSANNKTFTLTQDNFIQNQYVNKTIYFYLIVAYTINGVVVSNLHYAKNEIPTAYGVSIVNPTAPTITVPSGTVYLTLNQTDNLPTLSPTISGLNNAIDTSYQWYVSSSADAIYSDSLQSVLNANTVENGNATSETYTLPSSVASVVGVSYYYLLVREIVQESSGVSFIYKLSKPFEVDVVKNATLTFTNSSSTYKSEVNNNIPISLTADIDVNVPTNTKLSDYTIKFAWFSSTSSDWTYNSSMPNSYLAINSNNNTYTLNNDGTGYSDTYTIDDSYFSTARTIYFYVVSFLTLNGSTITTQSPSVYTLVVKNATNTSFSVSATSKTTQTAFVNQSNSITFSVAPSASGYSNPTYKYQWTLLNSQEVINTNVSYDVNNSTLEILPAFFSAAKNLVYACVVSLYVNNKLVATSNQVIFNLNVYSNLSIKIGSSSSPISVQPISDGSSVVSANSLNKTVIYGQSNNETLDISSYANALNANSSNVTLNNESYSYTWYTSNKDGAEVSAISSNSDYSVNNGTLVVNASNFSGSSFSNNTGTLYYLVVITLNNLEINAKAVTETVLISINVIAPPIFSFSNTQTNIDATVNETSYQTLTANATYTTTDNSFNNYQITYSWYKVVGNSDELVANTSSYTLTANDVLKSPGTVKFYVIASVTINGKTYTSNALDYIVTFISQPTINLAPSLLKNIVFQNQNSVVTLSASVTSSSQNLSLTYQWFICDANGNNATAISSNTSGYSGYNTNTLSINPSVYNDLTSSHTLYFYLQVTSKINGTTIYQNNNQKSIYSLLVNGNLHYDTTANQTNSTISVYAQASDVTLSASPSVVYEDYSVTPNTQATYNNVTFTYNWYETGNSTSLGTGNSFTIPSDLLTANTSFYYVTTATVNGVSLASSLGNYTSGKYNIDVSSLPTITLSANGYSTITTIVNSTPTSGFLSSISVSNLNSAIGGLNNLIYTWYKLDTNTIPSDIDATWVNNNKDNIVGKGQYFSDFSSDVTTSGTYYFYCLATASVNGTTIYSTSSSIFSLVVLNDPIISVNNVGNTSLNVYQDQSSAASFQVSASVSYGSGSYSNISSPYALNYQWFEVPANFNPTTDNLQSLINGTYSGATSISGATADAYALPISTLVTKSVGSSFYYFCVAYIKINSTYYVAQSGNTGKVNQVTIYSSPKLGLSTPAQSVNTYINTTSNVLQVNASVTATGANNKFQTLSVSSYTYNWYEVSSNEYTSSSLTTPLSTSTSNNSLNTFTIPSDLLSSQGTLYFVCEVEVPSINGVTLNTQTGGLVQEILFTVNVSSAPQITITSNLNNQIAFNGQKDPITFNINANINTNSSNVTFSYSWYKTSKKISGAPTASDGTLISGNDTSSYEISSITNTSSSATITYYFVIITAAISGYSSTITAVSNIASLTIYPTPTVSASQSSTQDIYVGQTSNLPGISTSLTWNGDYNAETTLNASYQWYKSQTGSLSDASSTSLTKIDGATSLSYQLTSTDSSLSTGNWYYYLVVTYTLPGNSSTSKITQIGTIDILSVPTIKVSALNSSVSATAGEKNYQTLVASVSLSPTSSVSAALTYTWYSSSTSGLNISELSSSATKLSNPNNLSSYTLTNSDVLSKAGTVYFYLVVSGKINGAQLAENYTDFSVTFSNSPTINVTINPTSPLTYYLNQTKEQNLYGTYSISTNTSLSNIQYSWYYSTSSNDLKNATQISGETNSSFTLTNAWVQSIDNTSGTSFYIYLNVSGTINENPVNGYSTIQIKVESAPTFSYPSGTTNIPSSPLKIYNPSSSSSSGTASSQSVTVGPTTQPSSTSTLSYSYQWYYSTTFNSSNPSSLSSSYEIPNATSNQYAFLPTNKANASGQTFNDIVGSDGGTIYLYLMVTGTNSNGASTSNYYGPYTFSIQDIPSISVALPTSPITIYQNTTSGFSTITPTLTATDSSNDPLTSSDFTISYLWQWKIKGSSKPWNPNSYPGDTDSILTLGTAFTQASFDNETLYIQLTVTITSNLDKASQTFVSSNEATVNVTNIPLLTITPTSSLDINGYVNQTTNFPTISYKISDAISGMEFNYNLYSTTNEGWALSKVGIWGFTGWTTVETIASTTSSSFSYTLNSSDFSSAQTVYYILAVKITYNGASTIQYWTGWTGSDSTATSAKSGVYVLNVNNLAKPTITLPSSSSFTWYEGQTSPIILKPEDVTSSISDATLTYQWIIQSYGNSSATTTVDANVPSSDNGNALSLAITSDYMQNGFFNLSNVPLKVGDTYNLALEVTLTINGVSVSATSSAFIVTYSALTNATIKLPSDSNFTLYKNQTNSVYFSPTVTNNMSSESATLSYQWKLVSYLPYDGKTTDFSNNGIDISSTYGGNNALLSMSYTNLNAILTANNSSLSVGTTYYFVLEVTTSLDGASVSTTSDSFSLQYTSIIPNLTLSTNVSTIYNGQTENLPKLSVKLNNASDFSDYTITYTWCVGYSDSSGVYLSNIATGSSFQITYSLLNSYSYPNNVTPYFMVFITLVTKDGYSQTFSSAQINTTGYNSGALVASLNNYSNGFLPITLEPVPTLVVNSKTTSTSIIQNQTIPVTFAPKSYDIVNSDNQSIVSGNTVTYSYQWYVMPTSDKDPQGQAQADSYAYTISDGDGISGATSSVLELTNASTYFQNTGNYFFYLKVSATWNGIALSSQYTYYYELSVSAIPTLTITLNNQNLQVYNGQSSNLPVLSFSSNASNSEFDTYNIKYDWYVAYGSASSNSIVSGQNVSLLGTGTSLQITYDLLDEYLYKNFDAKTGKSPVAYIFVQAIVTSSTGASSTIYSISTVTGISSNKLSGSLSSSNSGCVTIQAIIAPSITIDSSNNQATTVYKKQTSPVVFQPTSMTVNNSLNATYALTYQWYIMPTGSKPQGTAQSDSGGSVISGATAWNLELTNSSFTTTGNLYYYLAVTITVDGISSTTYSNYYELSVIDIPTLTFSSSSSSTDTTFGSYDIYTLQTQNLPLLNVYTNFSDSEFSGMSITYQWYVTYSTSAGSNVVIESNSDTASLQLQPSNFSFFVTNNSVGSFYVFLSATITTSTGASETFYSTPNTTVTTSGSKTTSSGDNLSSNVGYFQINTSAMPSFNLSSSSQTINTAVGYNGNINFSPTAISPSTSLISGAVVQYEYQWYDINNPKSTPSGTADSSTESTYSATTAKGTSTNYNYNVDSSYLSSAQTNYFYLVVTVIVNGYTLYSKLYSDFYCVTTQSLSSFTPNYTGSSMPWTNVNYYSNQTNSSVLSPQFTTPGDNLYGVSYTYDWYINNNQENLDGNVEQITNNSPTLDLVKFFADPSAYGVSSTIKGTGTYYIYLTVIQNIGTSSVNYNVQGYKINYQNSEQVIIGFNNGNTEYNVYYGSNNSIYLYANAYAYLNEKNNLVSDGYFEYQWYKNTTNSTTGGTEISGATLPMYEISNLSTFKVNSYYYYVKVTFISLNSGLSSSNPSYSTVFTVTVNSLPTITFSPLSSQKNWTNENTPVIVYKNTKQNFITLSPIVSLTGAYTSGVELTYNWYIEGSELSSSIPSATSQALTLDYTNFIQFKSGLKYFYLEVSMTIPGRTKPIIFDMNYYYYVNFETSPTISLNQLYNIIYILPNKYQGKGFSVIASTNIDSSMYNNADFTYSWQKSTSLNGSWTDISNVTDDYLPLSEVSSDTATTGTYYYKVTVSATYNGYILPSQSAIFYLVVMGSPNIGGVETASNEDGSNGSGFGTSVSGGVSKSYPYISIAPNNNTSAQDTDLPSSLYVKTLTYSAPSTFLNFTNDNYWLINQSSNVTFNDPVVPSSSQTSYDTSEYKTVSELSYQWQEATINNLGFYTWKNISNGTSQSLEISYNVLSNPTNYFRLEVYQTNYPTNITYSPLYVVNYDFGTTSENGINGSTFNLRNWLSNINNQKFVLASFLTGDNPNSWTNFNDPSSGSYDTYGSWSASWNYADNSNGTNTVGNIFSILYNDLGGNINFNDGITYLTSDGNNSSSAESYIGSATNNGGIFGVSYSYQDWTSSFYDTSQYTWPGYTINNLTYYPEGSYTVPGMNYKIFSNGLPVGAWMITGTLNQNLYYFYKFSWLDYLGKRNESGSSWGAGGMVPSGTQFHLLIPFSLAGNITYKNQSNSSISTNLTLSFNSSGPSLFWQNNGSKSNLNNGLWYYFGNNVPNSDFSGSSGYVYKYDTSYDPLLDKILYYGGFYFSNTSNGSGSAYVTLGNLTPSDSYLPSYSWLK